MKIVIWLSLMAPLGLSRAATLGHALTQASRVGAQDFLELFGELSTERATREIYLKLYHNLRTADASAQQVANYFTSLHAAYPDLVEQLAFDVFNARPTSTRKAADLVLNFDLQSEYALRNRQALNWLLGESLSYHLYNPELNPFARLATRFLRVPRHYHRRAVGTLHSSGLSEDWALGDATFVRLTLRAKKPARGAYANAIYSGKPLSKTYDLAGRLFTRADAAGKKIFYLDTYPWYSSHKRIIDPNDVLELRVGLPWGDLDLAGRDIRAEAVVWISHPDTGAREYSTRPFAARCLDVELRSVAEGQEAFFKFQALDELGQPTNYYFNALERDLAWIDAP